MTCTLTYIHYVHAASSVYYHLLSVTAMYTLDTCTLFCCWPWCVSYREYATHTAMYCNCRLCTLANHRTDYVTFLLLCFPFFVYIFIRSRYMHTTLHVHIVRVTATTTESNTAKKEKTRKMKIQSEKNRIWR